MKLQKQQTTTKDLKQHTVILENSKACQQKHGNKQRQRLSKDNSKSSQREKEQKTDSKAWRKEPKPERKMNEE